MFFSNSVKTSDVVCTIHGIDPIKICAQTLKRECQDYSFNENASKSAEILAESFQRYKHEDGLCAWKTFFKEMFPFVERSDQIQRKYDSIFQIFYNLINNSAKVSPQSIIIGQAVHDISRSKKLIDMLHRLGICFNYKSVLSIDMSAANEIIRKTGEYRVPVDDTIQPNAIIHGAMENFDHEENTLSGIGGSHDTILMLFQNREETIEDNPEEEIANTTLHPQNENLLTTVLPCQTLSKATNLGKRGEISPDLKTVEFKDTISTTTTTTTTTTKQQFKIWCAARQARLERKRWRYKLLWIMGLSCYILSVKNP